MTRMHKTRIGSLLAIGLLAAVILPQQNALGEVINTEGTGDASLRDITLSGIELSPAFSPDNAGHYKAWVDLTVDATTVMATPNDPGATVEILWGREGVTASTANRGRQVTLQEGGERYLRSGHIWERKEAWGNICHYCDEIGDTTVSCAGGGGVL